MSGLYEQQWQEAMSGVSIQPSDDLWNNIASSLDKESGRHNWLTILLIAATVTVAFAFPLTIGNSSLEISKSLENHITSNEGVDNNANASSASGIDKAIQKSNNELGANNSVDNTGQRNILKDNGGEKNERLLARTTAKEASVESLDKSTNKVVYGSETIALSNSSASGYGMEVFDLDNSIVVTDMHDYYFIPYYLPFSNSTDRSLLASLNMGTGSLNAGNGFNSFGLQNADFAEAAADLSSGFSDDRVENSGTTYYFAAGVELPIGKRWSLLAGLGYLAQNASGTSNIVVDAGNGYQPLGAYDPIAAGTIFLSESYNYTVTNSYINVPLTFKYPFVNRKIKFRGGIGISTDFMISHTINSDTYGKASYNPASMEYRTVVLAGLINLDLSYSLNKQYAIALETGLRKGFTSIDESKNYFPSSFTVGLVLFYKIR
jgi:hypothetical protein